MKPLHAVRLLVIAFGWALLSVCWGQLPDTFLRGGDVSEIPEVEASGGVFTYKGKQEDPFAMMKEAGWNMVRFRLWNSPTNDPKEAWCDKEHTLIMAKRAAAQGLKISLDFHYSDTWADPSKQTKPVAWKNLPFDQLVQAVYDYTKDVVSAMVAQGTPPYMVQVGNEITNGMLWPEGQLQGDDIPQWLHLGGLLRSALKGVTDAQGANTIVTMIHLDRGADNKIATWWFDHVAEVGVHFDAIGLSYYPRWHGPIDEMQLNINALAKRYNKDVYIVETGYPWVIDQRSGATPHVQGDSKNLLLGYPASAEGQQKFIAKLFEVVRGVPDGHGKGVLYWAPMWISTKTKKSGYDNMALFNYEGAALPGFDAMGGKQ